MPCRKNSGTEVNPHRHIKTGLAIAAATTVIAVVTASTVEKKNDDDNPDYPFAAAVIIPKEHKKAPFKVYYLY